MLNRFGNIQLKECWMTGIFLVIHSLIFSQYFNQVIETTLEHENTVAYNFEGDYFTSVNTMSDSNWMQNGWNIIQFKQYDSEFNIVRETRFQDSMYVYLQGANLTYENGFYYYSGFYKELFFQGNERAYIVKYDSIGNLIWLKDYFSNVPNARITHIREKNERIYIAGYHNFEPDSIVQHSFVSEIDSAGNIIWTEIMDDYGNSFVTSLQIFDSGEILINGRYNNGLQNRRVMVYKLNDTGNTEWSRTFGLTGSWLVNSASAYELPDGTILCYGGIPDPDGADFSRSWLFKLDSQGNMISDTIYKFSQNHDGFSVLYGKPIIKENEILLLGRYREDGSSYRNSYLASIDFDLNLNWIRIYGNYVAKNELTFLHDLENGFYLMAGRVSDDPNPIFDEWFMVVDSLGCDVAECSLGLEEDAITDNYFNIYPNPASNNITIEFSNSTKPNATNYQIIDLSGKVVQKGGLMNSNINVFGLDSGVYFVRLEQNGGYLGSRKLVIE